MMIQDQTAPAWTAGRNLRNIVQLATQGLLIALALTATIATVLSFLGVIPWLSLNLISASDESLAIGIWVQSLGTALLIGLCAFLPGVHHIQRLERSHRDFKLSMDDVARAYQISHAEDRSGVFALSSEFEDMRDRLDRMRKHPDLGHLEPEILELAAQMSHMTRDLALVYSEPKVARAKEFLRHRQEELDRFNENLSLALTVTQELQRWQNDVEASELEANRQMDRLEKDLKEILPQLGYEMDEDRRDDSDLVEAKVDDGKVVPLSSGSAAKSLTEADRQGSGFERPN
ncbi:DNA repair protein [Pacificibacter marinus]|uniref:DNA repair protein n=1 Tax=Pacificibacter marinus TaxID=658057 RepID=UPI001C072526|nr:DNA repair protein [Pacificibacter marinus]MBU2868643.1 DNA repair protein [Pacificibacter marinus]